MNHGHADVLQEMASKHGIAGPFAPRPDCPPSSLLGRALSAGLARLLLWQERATQRHRLSMIDDDALRDVGLRRADLAPEIRKWFWRS
jgi:uncharacterized protein YjiS (DUF1127 family)